MTLKFYDDGSGNSYTAMGVPGQLTTSNVTSNSADLTLPSGVTGAQYYELSESANNGATWTVVDSVIAPSSIVSPATYSRSGLTSGATYQWRLRAKFASLVSPLYSAVQSAVIQASVTAPAAPVLGTPTVTSNSVTAVVTNGNGAASYETRVSYNNGSTYSTPVSGLTVTGISASTSGILEVRGLASDGTAGAWSSTASFTTSAGTATAPGVPTIGTIEVTSSSVIATISASNGAATYQSRVSYNGGSTYTTPVGGLIVSGIPAATSGLYSVRGLASDGTPGPWSSDSAFTTNTSIPISSNALVDANFNAGDTLTTFTANDIGFEWRSSWGIGTHSYDTSFTKTGMKVRYPGTPNATTLIDLSGTTQTIPPKNTDGEWGASSQVTTAWVNRIKDVWFRYNLYIPSNYHFRRVIGAQLLDLNQDVSAWNVGDEISAVDPVSGTTYYGTYFGYYLGNSATDGHEYNSIWIHNAQNSDSHSTWGDNTNPVTVTNVTQNLTVQIISRVGASYNNKFLAAWVNGGIYDTQADTGDLGAMVVETYGSPYNPVNYNDVLINADARVQTAVYDPADFGNSTHSGNQLSTTAVNQIYTAADVGAEHEFVVRFAFGSSFLGGDAKCQIWKDGVKVFEKLDYGSTTPGSGYPTLYNTQQEWFNRAYLLGAANMGYDELTEFMITRFRMYNSNPDPATYV